MKSNLIFCWRSSGSTSVSMVDRRLRLREWRSDRLRCSAGHGGKQIGSRDLRRLRIPYSLLVLIKAYGVWTDMSSIDVRSMMVVGARLLRRDAFAVPWGAMSPPWRAPPSCRRQPRGRAWPPAPLSHTTGTPHSHLPIDRVISAYLLQYELQLTPRKIHTIVLEGLKVISPRKKSKQLS